MFKVITYYTRSGRQRDTRLYQSEEQFERYGREYIGYAHGAHAFGVAFKLTDVRPAVWVPITTVFKDRPPYG